MRPLVLLLALTLALTGCAGYRLGPTDGASSGARSVRVSPFINQTVEAGMADEVTVALRAAIQRDGTLRLVTRGAADLEVTGVLKDYRRRELSLSRADARTVQDYQVALTARVVVRETATGTVRLDREVSAGALVRVGEDFVSSERQIVPRLAGELARQITSLLADGDW
ncbi:MAG: LPS assembly lipoprotein LptE [Limisphaerales bacterium]